MKRSEMITIISNFLNGMIREESLNIVSTRLLTELEKNGMCLVTIGMNENDLKSLDWEPE